jgi:hypothetical protein
MALGCTMLIKMTVCIITLSRVATFSKMALGWMTLTEMIVGLMTLSSDFSKMTLGYRSAGIMTARSDFQQNDS